MIRGEHIMAGRALRFGLENEIARLRSEEGAGEGGGGRNAITLVKDGPLRVVLVVLGSGREMDEHAAPGPATVHVLEGRVRIAAEAEECTCERGAFVVFEGGVEHRVIAEAESTLLLTVVDPRVVLDPGRQRVATPRPEG
jgi:quercetin dioxygenase-like cupin family protein